MMAREVMFLTLILLSAGAQSTGPLGVVQGGQVHLRGVVVNGTCSVAPKSRSMYVDMGQHRSNQFRGVGSYAGPVDFSVHLSNCVRAVREGMVIRFMGVTDGKDPLVLRAGGDDNSGATGMGLAIFDSQDNLLPLNRDMIVVPDIQQAGNVVTEMKFTARYRATSRQVAGGKADALTWFTLDYE